MIRYRPFLNTDPPALAEIWCSQPRSRGLVQPMTAAMLDDLVLAQPYFDRDGLVVALEDDSPIGFAHAGFGPSQDGAALDRQTGTICGLMVRPGVSAKVGADLLQSCEQYLRDRGVRQIYGGATKRLAPFYLGLYGGCQLPGVLRSDEFQTACFREAGYRELSSSMIFECPLVGFRPATDRQLLQIRRQHPVVPKTLVRPGTWWDACQRPNWEAVQFQTSGFQSTSSATFWDIEPLASSWGTHAMGLWDLSLPEEQEHGMLTVYLLGESMRALQAQGISLVEAQAGAENHSLRDACLRLGFCEVDRGVQFLRDD